ncbi:potassium ABC transporter ATPase [Noviherbaspirillum sp.]|nr:potassium ABC transporter ATPase [Noviherbaspirillum sp.]HJV79349.1 potassium ABC transporter ATPase [Noviherbaspirillum sp.]
MDIVFIGGIIGFLALTWGLAGACEQLETRQ